jgi:hypothetical protein
MSGKAKYKINYRYITINSRVRWEGDEKEGAHASCEEDGVRELSAHC